jgi:acyl-CoA synthetase (NDP forming)
VDIGKELDRIVRSKAGALTEHEAKAILEAAGVPAVREIAAPDPEAALAAARTIGFPVVVKALGRALTHKTDRGLVRLHLGDPASVRRAVEEMAGAAGEDLEGYLVQPQLPGRRELVAGLFRDPQFGPVVMFGTGGVFTEAFSDVTFRLAPLSKADAREMLTEIRGAAFLGAFRGEAPADRDALVRTILGLSRLGTEHPEISEIDVNPLLVTPDGGVQAVDALITVRLPQPAGAVPPPVAPERLGRLFHPRAIAFVGATAQMGKWGHIMPTITASKGFAGEIYMVNPKGGTIVDRPVYRSVAEIPGPVDLAVVTIPAAGVIDLIPELAEKGIDNMLLITSGFAETGDDGRRLETALVAKAREFGMVLVGPNTMGICNPHIKLYCTGSHVWPQSGGTAVVAQSGNMGTQLLGFAEQQGIGIRCFSGSGNEAMVTIEDYLAAFEVDERTRGITLYVESVKNGRRFFDLARRITRKKPIVLLKGGRSDAGNRAAATHTGAMASDTGVFEAVCRQAGIVKVQYPMDLLDISAAFSSLPLPRGNRVAIMTLGGGWGVVTADLCAEHGLTVPALSPEIIARIDEILPPYWSRSNPVDIVGESDDTTPVVILETLLEWTGCDAVINLGIIGRSNLLGRYIRSTRAADPAYSQAFLDEVAEQIRRFEAGYIERIVSLMAKYDKPVYGVSILTTDEDQTVYRVEGSRLKSVFYPTPERAVQAVAKMLEYRRYLDREDG